MVCGENGRRQEAVSETMKARKGVVKMLMASVIIYFISYSPHQILLLYNTFSHAPFHQTWVFLVLVTAMGYINSAANPILYSIFSQKFRQKFLSVLLCCVPKRRNPAGSSVGLHESADSGVSKPSTNASTNRDFEYQESYFKNICKLIVVFIQGFSKKKHWHPKKKKRTLT